jgi:hypothetical protein
MLKGVKGVKPANLNSMPVSDEDPEHTNRRPATRRPPLDHTMVYVPGKNLNLRPFGADQKGAKRCKQCQTCTSKLDDSV